MKKLSVIAISILTVLFLTAQTLPRNSGSCNLYVNIPALDPDYNIRFLEPTVVTVACVDVDKIKALDEWAREGWTIVDSLDEYIEENCNG